MKKSLCLLLCSTGLSLADERYTNEIRVEHMDGTQYSLDIAAEGTRTDTRGVLGSARYSLYTIKNEDNTPYFLDEKTVSSYHPQSAVRITSADPYEAIPRTRVDYPFNVEYDITGLITDDPDVQDAAKSVVFDHRIVAYAPGATEAAADATWTLHDHDPVGQNGTHYINNILTQIESDNLPDARGEEIFSIYANPDWGVAPDASLLAQQRVQIWPIAKGTVSGIDTAVEYAKLPVVTVELVDLYPASTTYLRVYKGAPTPTPATVIKINTSFVIIDDVLPTDRTFVLTELDSKITEDAIYTVEIVHETPFGADLLGQLYPLNIKRSIKINGNVNSSE
ncbi:MAG: hypothetical protein QNK86_06355 [Akkermansiaceae bacterium]|jgi:hypothetical protein|tara:strand:+ start:20841 stop:21851 length:1011 start_codon:yes stop_codon:yes gene_type:complete